MRKGEQYRRKCDGFVFEVMRASRKSKGASMRCVEAERLFGWFTFEAIARDFERVKGGAK